MKLLSRIFPTLQRPLAGSRKQPPLHARSHFRGVVDIGTSTVRFGIVEVMPNQLLLRGYARVEQLPNAMAGGVIIDIERVMDSVARAAEMASIEPEIRLEHVVAGIAGELVRGSTLSTTMERSSPENRITASELQHLIDVLERKASYLARKTIAEEQGLSEVDIRILHAVLLRMRIDGQAIANPLHFQGRVVELTAYHGFAPLVHLGAIQTVLHHLGFSIESIIAEPFALSAAAVSPGKPEVEDALIVDIGAGTTDIAVIRSGGIEATRSYACAGDAFTQHLSTYLGVSIEDAEMRKRAYATGEVSMTQKTHMKNSIDRVLGLWKRGFEIACSELSGGLPLPTRILLSGGGALLPDISRALHGPWHETAGLYAPIHIHHRTSKDFTVHDPQGLARDHRDLTALALASMLQSQPNESVVNHMFTRIQRMITS